MVINPNNPDYTDQSELANIIQNNIYFYRAVWIYILIVIAFDIQIDGPNLSIRIKQTIYLPFNTFFFNQDCGLIKRLLDTIPCGSGSRSFFYACLPKNRIHFSLIPRLNREQGTIKTIYVSKFRTNVVAATRISFFPRCGCTVIRLRIRRKILPRTHSKAQNSIYNIRKVLFRISGYSSFMWFHNHRSLKTDYIIFITSQRMCTVQPYRIFSAIQ